MSALFIYDCPENGGAISYILPVRLLCVCSEKKRKKTWSKKAVEIEKMLNFATQTAKQKPRSGVMRGGKRKT